VGYCIESASTLTVVLATLVGLPVSSTHCQVGAVVFLGVARFGTRGTDWRIFGKIGVSWLTTLPLSMGVAAAAAAVGRAVISR